MILDTVGLFLLLAGFIIGLGSVTVIDIHGFLGKSSPYWTRATITAHKITKPLIWVGFLLVFVGGYLFYRDIGMTGVVWVHLVSGIILMINGLFLSFAVSPFLLKREREGLSEVLLPRSLQNKIAVSFVVSFVGWWGNLLLLSWQLVG